MPVTTVQLSESDNANILKIIAHLQPMTPMAVSKRGAISWALTQACATLSGNQSHSGE